MGKTAVFVLATLHQLEPVDGEVSVLVMCHTRELAYQIKGEYDRFAKYLPGVKAEVIYGGVPEREHTALLASNCPHIVVATPGRIMDHLKRGTLSLGNIRHVVLDEADEMLDMGFSKDIEEILGFVDMEKSQCVLFSATTPTWIERLAKQYLKNPLRLDASNDGESRTATTVSRRRCLVLML